MYGRSMKNEEKKEIDITKTEIPKALTIQGPAQNLKLYWWVYPLHQFFTPFLISNEKRNT